MEIMHDIESMSTKPNMAIVAIDAETQALHAIKLLNAINYDWSPQ